MSEERTELLEILELTRDFALAELRPRSEAWDRAGALDDAVLAQLAELGFLGMGAPESAGGMALERPALVGALEQLAWGEASVALAVALQAQVTELVASHGAGSASERWLPQLAAGEVIACAQTTVEYPPSVQARRADGGWVLEGTVPWVGNARSGGLLAVSAAAESGPLQCVLPLAEAGVELGPPAATMGLRPLGLRAVTLREVRLGGDAVLGGPGIPPRELMAQATAPALHVAAVAAGVGQAALEHARDYANVREQFGRKLREFEGIRHKLADVAIRVAAARALLARAAAAGDLTTAALAKVAAAEAAMFASTQAVQVFGGYGYMRDYPVEKLMRDAKAMSLLGGTDEWHRSGIAERLYEG